MVHDLDDLQLADGTPSAPRSDHVASNGERGFRHAFLAVASHELRTPIQAIALNVAMMRSRVEGSADELPRRWLTERLQRTQRLVDQMARLVDGLLNMAEVTSDQLELRRETFDLSELTRSVVADAAERLQWAGCACDLDAPAPVVGSWDRFRVSMVIDNLLANATKYAAGAEVHVRVWADEADAHVVVADDGPGIAPIDRERIFERFTRSARPAGASGFGLGLWIVRSIAEAHGGSVTLGEGPGASFAVTLPFRPVRAPAEAP